MAKVLILNQAPNSPEYVVRQREFKRGDVVVAYPDDYVWQGKEQWPKFVCAFIPGSPASFASFVQEGKPSKIFARNGQPATHPMRAYGVDVDKLVAGRDTQTTIELSRSALSDAILNVRGI